MYRLEHIDFSNVEVSNTWFGLPEEIASGLFASATSRCLKANDTLFQSGDTGDGCYLLNSGMLKVIVTSSQGDERILAILAPGTIVGDLAMIDGLPQSASVIALTDCELCFVSRTDFEHFASQNPEIYQYLLKVLAARLRQADKTYRIVGFLVGERPRGPRPARACENCRLGERLRRSLDPPHDKSERPCCDGGSRSRECKSGLGRLPAE